MKVSRMNYWRIVQAKNMIKNSCKCKNCKDSQIWWMKRIIELQTKGGE